MKLYIQENQGAASIINQLTKVDSNEIKLIFPNETDFFNNSDNLELLMNQARLLKKNISIITENPDHLLLIQKFGIKGDNSNSYSRKDNNEQNIKQNNEGSYLDEIGKDFNEEEQEIKNKEREIENKYQEIENAEQDSEIYKQEISQESKDEDEDIPQIQNNARKYSDKLKFLLTWKIIAGIAIIIAVIWGYFYLPKAQIKIFSVKEKIRS